MYSIGNTPPSLPPQGGGGRFGQEMVNNQNQIQKAFVRTKYRRIAGEKNVYFFLRVGEIIEAKHKFSFFIRLLAGGGGGG
jgi:hypothetical protein